MLPAGIDFQDPLNIWLRAADANRGVESLGLYQNGSWGILNLVQASFGPKFLLNGNASKDVDQVGTLLHGRITALEHECPIPKN